MTVREKLTRQKRLADIVSIAGIGGAMLFFYVASSQSLVGFCRNTLRARSIL
jgi:hypothetical protein